MRYLSNVSTLEFYSGKCTGCGMCVNVCPHEVFEIREGQAVIIERNRCMECGACVTNCAFGALSVARGVGCAAALINSMIRGGEPTCDCTTESSGCC
ncbi:MAG: 4Fe-4S binding protein [Nitrospirae bacterium YQR-1]